MITVPLLRSKRFNKAQEMRIMSTSWTNICLFASCSYASSGEVDKSVNNLRAGQFPPIIMDHETTEGKPA